MKTDFSLNSIKKSQGRMIRVVTIHHRVGQAYDSQSPRTQRARSMSVSKNSEDFKEMKLLGTWQNLFAIYTAVVLLICSNHRKRKLNVRTYRGL